MTAPPRWPARQREGDVHLRATTPDEATLEPARLFSLYLDFALERRGAPVGTGEGGTVERDGILCFGLPSSFVCLFAMKME